MLPSHYSESPNRVGIRGSSASQPLKTTKGARPRDILNTSVSPYLLVARDHLKWVPPSDGIAIVAFNPFKAALQAINFDSALDSF